MHVKHAIGQIEIKKAKTNSNKSVKFLFKNSNKISDCFGSKNVGIVGFEGKIGKSRNKTKKVGKVGKSRKK